MGIGRVRPAIDGLAAYRPGKAAAQAEEEHGVEHAIKLASNENPYAPVPAVAEAVAGVIDEVNRYADHRASELRAALAGWVGVDPAQVTVGCGSVGLLQQLCLTYLDPGDEAVFPWPSFEAYPICVKMMAALPVNPPLVDHAFDLAAVADAVTERTKLVMLATPNNPTGTAVSTAQIGELLAAIPDHVVVLVDEAYREFNDPALGDPVTDLVPNHPNVIVTRTFSKAYGLAGLRVGFAITDPSIVAQLDKILIPFAVNAAGQAGALAALGALDDIQPKIDLIRSERTRVVDSLTEAGWKLPPANANFVYLPTGEATVDIHLGLERRGVVTRPFPGEGIRVTIGTVEENDRFLRSLAEATAAE
ncbi:MAG: histidinol-phosphate transaminase [Actinomycetota bacterium]